jgi:multiple sugar transport system permease protein
MKDETLKLKLEWKKSKRKQGITALLLLSPYLIIFILHTLIPFLMGLVYSLMQYNPYDPSANHFVGLKNYHMVFNLDNLVTKSFWDSFKTMFLFDIVAVPLMIIIPLTLAHFLNYNPPGYKLFRAIIYLPSVVSITIVGIIFGNMFAGDSGGLINAWLGTEIKWLSGKPFVNDTLRWLVMLIASIWWQTGTNFVIFSGALRDVPQSLYEACEMDGGNRIQRFRYVTLPNIKSATTICLFNTLIGYLNLYGQPTVLNEIENEGLLVSPMMFIQKYLGGVQYAKQTGYICACAIVFGLIVMVFSTIQRLLSRERKRNNARSMDCKNYIENKQIVQMAVMTDEGDLNG